MKFVLSVVLALMSFPLWAVSMTQSNCSWNNPGVNPYTGSVDAAMSYYSDIPRDTRDILTARIKDKHYDEIVAITKDAVTGKSKYSPVIKDMHFGRNLVCTNVSRDRWTEKMLHRAFMYCEGGYCVIVPFVCGNISRIEKLEEKEIELPPLEVPGEYSIPASRMAVTPVPTEVPEPGSVALMFGGLASLIVMRSRRK
jgi:hypothetical protein